MRERTNEVEVERDVKVMASDGTGLLTDVYHPVGINDAPTILERTPYGRVNFASAMAPRTRDWRLLNSSMGKSCFDMMLSRQLNFCGAVVFAKAVCRLHFAPSTLDAKACASTVVRLIMPAV